MITTAVFGLNALIWASTCNPCSFDKRDIGVALLTQVQRFFAVPRDFDTVTCTYEKSGEVSPNITFIVGNQDMPLLLRRTLASRLTMRPLFSWAA